VHKQWDRGEGLWKQKRAYLINFSHELLILGHAVVSGVYAAGDTSISFLFPYQQESKPIIV